MASAYLIMFWQPCWRTGSQINLEKRLVYSMKGKLASKSSLKSSTWRTLHSAIKSLCAKSYFCSLLMGGRILSLLFALKYWTQRSDTLALLYIIFAAINMAAQQISSRSYSRQDFSRKKSWLYMIAMAVVPGACLSSFEASMMNCALPSLSSRYYSNDMS